MKAVLIVPDSGVTPCPRIPLLPLFPLLDRPFIQHIIEALARRGIREILLVLGREMDPVQQFLGDGARWGCTFVYRFADDAEKVGWNHAGVVTGNEPILIAHADQLPALPTVLRGTLPGLLFGTPGNWSGWAIADPAMLRSAPENTPLIQHLEDHQLNWVDVGQPVGVRSLADVPPAQKALLNAALPGAIVTAHETQAAVWMGRNVRLGAGAKVIGPAFVGDNTVLAAGASVGPNAVVGANCVLGHDSSVRESTVCPESFVGVGVQLDGVIVDGQCLVNSRLQTVETIDRRFLDRLTPGLPLTAGAGYLVAKFASAVALPIVLVTYFWRRRRFSRNRHPAMENSRDEMKVPVRGVS